MLVGDIASHLRWVPAEGPADVIASGAVPGASREAFRQAAQSRIITSAHRIDHDPYLNPPEAESDFYFVQADDPESAGGASSNW